MTGLLLIREQKIVLCYLAYSPIEDSIGDSGLDIMISWKATSIENI